MLKGPEKANDGESLLKKLELQAPLLLHEYGLETLESFTGKPPDIFNFEIGTSPKVIARDLRNRRDALILEGVRYGFEGFNLKLSQLFRAFLAYSFKKILPGYELYMLGNLSSGELILDDEAELFAFRPQGERGGIEKFLAFLEDIFEFGLDLEVQFPIGYPDGLTREEFQVYELEVMNDLERFKLGNASVLVGDEEGLKLLRDAAHANPLTPDLLQDLVAIKRMIESEFTLPKHWHRNLVSGYGGLADLEWLVRLYEWRYPELAGRGGKTMKERLRTLMENQILNAVEMEALAEAHAHLTLLRVRLSLLGYSNSVMPENPDKLDRLARAYGLERGNALLRIHEPHREAVRGIYNESLDRLKV